jgi:hypothetical protein
MINNKRKEKNTMKKKFLMVLVAVVLFTGSIYIGLNSEGGPEDPGNPKGTITFSQFLK